MPEQQDDAGTPARFTAAQVAAAAALCDAPHGAADPATRETITDKLTGGWLRCTKEPGVFRLAKTSIELTSDGHWYALLPDGASGLKRAQGLEGEGSWRAQDVSSWIEPGPFFPEFEANPRRMRMTVATSGEVSWFVAIGE